MQTVTFHHDPWVGGYGCSLPGNQSGEYVKAFELTRVTAQRDALLEAPECTAEALRAAVASHGGTRNDERTLAQAEAAIAQTRG